MGDLYYILLYLISATHYHYQSAANSTIASAEKRCFLALFISGDNLQGADIKFIMTVTHWTIKSIILCSISVGNSAGFPCFQT